MRHDKVIIPLKVMDGLEAIRLSGKTNMFDVPVVVFLALDMGYLETATWVHENKSIYVQGIIRGFATEEETADSEDGLLGRITGCTGGGEPCAD